MPQALDIPHEAPFLQATFEHSHVNLTVEPDDPSFAYSVLIPKTWGYSREFGPVPAGMFETRGIGFFTSAAERGAPVIAVTVTTVPFEIPIDAWARASFANEGWSIVEASWFPGASGLYFDLTGTRVVDDVTEVRRTAVRVRGTEIFSVNCMTARKHWDAVKDTFWLAITSFELANAGTTRMEPWLEAKSEQPPAFRCAFPASWLAEKVEGAPEGVSALDLRLLDGDAETLFAYLQVKAKRETPAPSLEALQATALASVERSGFAATGEPMRLTEDDDPRCIAVPGWLGGVEVPGTLGDGEISLRLGFVVRDGVAITFALLRPQPQNNPLVALRALRTLEIARATFTLSG